MIEASGLERCLSHFCNSSATFRRPAMSTRIMAAVLLLSGVHAADGDSTRTLVGGTAKRSDQWTLETATGLILIIQLEPNGTLAYQITVGTAAEIWLRSSPAVPRPRAWCRNKWHDFANPATSTVDSTRTTDSVSILYSSTEQGRRQGSGASFSMNVTFEVDTGNASFLFRQSFPDGCSNSSGLNIPPMAGRSFNSTSVPLSEFPTWDYSADSLLQSRLGYITWAGLFAFTRASQGIGLRGYTGGSEGGPIALFEPGATDRPALVMSPFDEFMSSILALRHLEGSSAAPMCGAGSSHFENNVDYIQHDFPASSLKGVPSASACCKACTLDTACRAWSWIGPNCTNPACAPLIGNCYMKWSAVGRSVSHGHVSGQVEKHAVLVGGVQGRVAFIPPGHSTTVIITGSATGGVRPTLEKWGVALRERHGTKRATQSLTETKLSAWTDNGAYWFYLNMPTPAELSSTIRGMITAGVPLKSVQLDPWAWSPICNATPFTNLLTLSKSMFSLPFTLYTSYWCPTTSADHFGLSFLTSKPYRTTSSKGHTSTRMFAQVAPNSSFALYDRLLSSYPGLVAGYEVDFLSYYPLLVPEFITTIDSAAAWAKGMADAATKNDVTIQYCMALPSWLLQSLTYPSVTNARASGDNFPSNKHRWRIGYTSLLHWPLQLRSFMDVVWSTADQPGNEYGVNRTNVELQAAVAALSAGPVGFGDGPGYSDVSVILRTCAADGTLLRPSIPATPIDTMLDGDRDPTQSDNNEVEVWDAASVVGELVFWSVLVVDASPAVPVKLSELYLPTDISPVRGWPGAVAKYVVVNVDACKNGTMVEMCGAVIPASSGGFVARTNTAGSVDAHDWTVLNVTPMCPSGAVLLGEVGKTVGVSPDRFAVVECTAKGLRMRLKPSVANEFVHIAVGLGGTVLRFALRQPSGQIGASAMCDMSGCTISV